MNTGKSNKLLVLGLVSLLLLPAAPVWSIGTGNEGGARSRDTTDHNVSVIVTDFTGMKLGNVAVRPKGGLGLLPGPGTWKNDFPAISGDKNTDQPSIAANSKNEFVITWSDERHGANNPDIYAQRFDVKGNKIGGEILVCDKPNQQYYPVIAVDSHDNFVIAWQDQRISDLNIYAQKFDVNGTKVGAEIVVCDVAGNQAFPAIAENSKDEFYVTWEDYRNFGTTGWDVYAQKFSKDGLKVGAEIAVCTQSHDQSSSTIAIDTQDRLLVAWSDGRNTGAMIYVQRYDADGNKWGSEIIVHPGSTWQGGPSIAITPNDGFIIVWNDFRNNQNNNVYSQRFDPGAVPVGAEIEITNSTNNTQSPKIVINEWGSSILSWSQASIIYARWIDQNGTLSGDAIKIGQGTTGAQLRPAMTIDSRNDVVVAWQDYRSTTKWEIYARQLMVTYPPSGNLETNDINGTNLWAWKNLSVDSEFQNPYGNSLSYEFSTDSGASWQPVPVNGSLAGAAAAPKLRLRVNFATTDELATPILKSLTVNYMADRLPTVSLPADFEMWKDNLATIGATASDPDGDMLVFNWTQTAGPGLALGGAQTGNVSFTPNISGKLAFKVMVNDGYGSSAPALINITVKNNIPTAVLTVKTASAKVDSAVLFDASGSTDPDDNIASYLFDFGDGKNSGPITTPKINHTYTKEGKFTVKLTVYDDEGQPANSTPIMVNVQKASGEGLGGITMILAAVIIIVVVVALLAIIMMRRRKPTTVIQYQPPVPQAPAQQALPTAPPPQMQPGPVASPPVQAPPPAPPQMQPGPPVPAQPGRPPDTPPPS